MLNRWGKMDELVGTIIFLATDQAKYITGQKIIIDGGIVSKDFKNESKHNKFDYFNKTWS